MNFSILCGCKNVCISNFKLIDYKSIVFNKRQLLDKNRAENRKKNSKAYCSVKCLLPKQTCMQDLVKIDR